MSYLECRVSVCVSRPPFLVLTKTMKMKKLTTVLLLMIFAVNLFAPEYKSLYILPGEKISFYEPLIRAITWKESRHGKYVWNPIENAVGWFQIRPIRVEDYNRKVGTSYRLEDFYSYELSREMFLYYAKGKTFETAAKNWNGSGPKTIDYWNDVKLNL